MRIAFDIGGVLSKYPRVFRLLIECLWRDNLEHEGVDVHIISDMHPKQLMLDMLRLNGFDFLLDDKIHSADYRTHGESCKAVLCEELGIDVLVDDFMGYVASGNHVRLLVMPNPNEPYYHDEWKTDGSEGDFGRRKPT